MNSNSRSVGSGDLNLKQPGVKINGSPTDPSKHTVKPSVEPNQQSGKRGVSSSRPLSGEASSKKLKGKAIVSTDLVVFFDDVKLGPQQGELRFRLLHFWESRKVLTKQLLGLEMLLIDEKGTVIQGFIPSGRIQIYLPHMVPGSLYRLTPFYESEGKTLYRVAEPNVTVTFSWDSVLTVLEDSPVCFPEDRFRFYGYEEFEAGCDLRGDLYDYLGHTKLVNGQTPNESLVLDEEELASTRRILIHVQTQDGPVMKLYLWDDAARAFFGKFKAIGTSPSVILVTTVNPKRFRGALTLSSFSSSRVFTDTDVQPTRDYLAWLGKNLDVAGRVNADIVTKAETATIQDLFSYMKQDEAKIAWFECKATVGDVVHCSPWYYIGCRVCHTKATKGHTTMMCKKCGKAEITAVLLYHAKLSIHDKKDHASVVILGDAGFELTGRKASELVESYFEGNESIGDDHLVPVPHALIDTIGETRTFVVKVTKHNLTGKSRSLTVTKVLPLGAEEPEVELEENVIGPAAESTLQLGNPEAGPFVGYKEPGVDSVKSSEVSEVLPTEVEELEAEKDEAKRPRSG